MKLNLELYLMVFFLDLFIYIFFITELRIYNKSLRGKQLVVMIKV